MSDDLIKRSDAIEAVSISCRTCLARDIEDCKKCSVPKLRELINAIPSADRQQGEWIEGEIFYFCGEQQLPMKCSVCGRTALNEPWTFCPNCGAKMKGEDDE